MKSIKELNVMRTEFEHRIERHLDLQMRSTRNNLIFKGIQEMEDEHTEETLREFLKTKMNIAEEPLSNRVDRMGFCLFGVYRPTREFSLI